ncbi:GPI transamidase component PIG-T [Crucibulum laeve]|uniref:GPI transamidase component PIG-T n=1 Tax=Crucibulum laeve TaxID=68775 RepID=A0A5C3M0L9_9AGAR|nr:GPI transamidase component PIG-T [Crucibulum laeve]
MLANFKISLFFICNLCLLVLANSSEQFDEELSIKSLQDGKVASKFSFKTLLKGASPKDPRTLGTDDESQHYTLFPLGLGQILREYGVTELHLTLNAGNWNYGRWGYPEEKGVGPGAELWVWMGDGAPNSIDHRWKGLRNALAGLFCASLGSLDEQCTTSPVRSFSPEGVLPDWDLPHQIRHASLPSEHVCTENLTPFLKLLPCKSLSGIASLLNPHRLFDADWHGMGIHVLWRGKEGIEVRLTFQSIMDPSRSSSKQKQDWSLQSLFDRAIDRTCPIAHSSLISVSLPSSGAHSITPEPSRVDSGSAIFDVATVPKPFNAAMNWPSDFEYQYDTSLTPLKIQRTLKGSSQARGQLSLVIANHGQVSQQVVYLETMPWLVQFYLHTLKTSVNGAESDAVISNITYIPAIPHSRPTTFEAVLLLPARSTTRLTMDVTKAFLRYTEHPPDAQRGWDLPPAVFTPIHGGQSQNATAGLPSERIYTPALLVDLATPDFSMPYNVIIFSCSLMAFLFGSIFNLLTRRFVVVHVGSGKQE